LSEEPQFRYVPALGIFDKHCQNYKNVYIISYTVFHLSVYGFSKAVALHLKERFYNSRCQSTLFFPRKVENLRCFILWYLHFYIQSHLTSSHLWRFF